jgi:transcription initiation factor TFIID subunit 2
VQFSDTAYLSTIFQALSDAFIDVKTMPEGNPDFFGALQTQNTYVTATLIANAVDEVSRYVNLDRLVPSYRNLITLSGLEWKFKMMFSGLIPGDLKIFFSYSRYVCI